MSIDLKKYLKYFDDPHLSESEKLEHLRALKLILETFIDSAFGLHPVQQCREKLNQTNLQNSNKIVDSKTIQSQFNDEISSS